MSITLPTVDMSHAIVGTQGKISFANAGLTSYPNPLNKAILHFYNESGFGLLISFSVSPNSDYVPARGAREYILEPGESQLNYSVLFANPSTPVQLLIAVVYLPNEAVPDPPHSGTDLNPFNTSGLLTPIAANLFSIGTGGGNISLPGVPNKTTYITNFDATCDKPAGAVVYIFTLSGIGGATIFYYAEATAAVTLELARIFPTPMPASIVGGQILLAVSYSSGAANNTGVSVNMYGFQL